MEYSNYSCYITAFYAMKCQNVCFEDNGPQGLFSRKIYSAKTSSSIQEITTANPKKLGCHVKHHFHSHILKWIRSPSDQQHVHLENNLNQTQCLNISAFLEVKQALLLMQEIQEKMTAALNCLSLLISSKITLDKLRNNRLYGKGTTCWPCSN